MSNVYDRGPRPHAMGTVQQELVYIVVAGDTWYSIGQRFGVPWQQILTANGLPQDAQVLPGFRLRIPGLTQPSPPAPKRLSFSSPQQGDNVICAGPQQFQGTGAGIPDARFSVRVKYANGTQIAEMPAYLQGPEVSNGGEGTWRVQFGRLPAAPGTGHIEARTIDGSYGTFVVVQLV